jgi:putative tryptophan/tyrosine transport system substrate-binding protein
MKRREFIRLVGTTLGAAALPNGSIAQTPSRVYRLGLLSGGAPVTDASPYWTPLIRALEQKGYALDRNVVFERRGAEGHFDRLPRLVEELVASKVDLIVTIGYPPAFAVKQGTSLPAVAFAAGDPVGGGLADSLARPGSNITGISDVSSELTPKRMDLLKQIAPGLRLVAML